MSDLVSIIVPIYGVEEYLNKCINSIINQTYKNLEIILVDDGSPDKCPEICDAFEKKDDRIKVIHKKNGGLSDARNAGLDIAHGDYFVFVDSDDWIEKHNGRAFALCNVKNTMLKWRLVLDILQMVIQLEQSHSMAQQEHIQLKKY